MNRRDLFKAAAGAMVGGREVVRRFTFSGLPTDHLPKTIGGWTELKDEAINEAKSIGRTALRVLGPPEHLKRQWREETRYIGALDPDLEAMKSWSFSRKVVEQQRRNYNTREQLFWNRFDLQKIEKDFYERYGYVDFSKS